MDLINLAKQLSNKVNQEHCIMSYLDKVSNYFYKKGFEEGAKTAADDISSKI